MLISSRTPFHFFFIAVAAFLLLPFLSNAQERQGSEKAISFSGNSGYVEVAQDPSLAFNAGDPYTLEVWFKGTGTQAILSRMNRSNNTRGYDIWVDSDGTVAMHLIHSWSGDALKMSSDKVVNDGRWHHIAVTYDGSSSPSGVSIWVDGVERALSTENNNLSSSNTTPSVPFTIGCRSDGGGTTQHIDGIVDEVRIWDHVRTGTQIRENMCKLLSGSESGLMAYYRLDENDGISNVVDHSGNGNDGTCQSLSTNNDRILSGASLGKNSSYLYPSSSDKGLDLSGGGKNVEVPQDASIEFNANDAYSLSVWYKGTSTGSAILSMMDQGNSYKGWDVWVEGDGTVAMHLINSWSGNALKMSSNTTVSDGAWHHLVVTYDGSKSPSGVNIYVDGTNTSLNTANDNLSNNDTDPDVPFRIGGRSNGGSLVQEINGKVDEVSIWGQVLSSGYISDLANCDTSIAGSESNLQAFYDMEGSGTTVTDQSSNSNDGTMQNMTSSDRVDVSHCGPVWSGLELYHTGNDGDSLRANNVSGKPQGIHIYSVDTFPNTLNGASGVGGNETYYGVFLAGGSSPSYDATYYYRENDAYQNSTNLDESAMALFKRDDNSDQTWSDAGATLDQNAKTLLATNMNTEFILGNNSDPLPIELLSFHGYQKDDKVLLKWITASEQNNDHFQVLRSKNGKRWTSIERVEGKGTSVEKNVYRVEDEEPLSGVSYYKLHQVDHDGDSTDHGPITVNFERPYRIDLYPVPADETLSLRGNIQGEGSLSIKIYSAQGILKKEWKMASSELHNRRLSVEDLSNGTYFLRIADRKKDLSQVERFTISR